jgi:hypothetical protein
LGNPGSSKQSGPDGFPSKGELVYFIPISRQKGKYFIGIGPRTNLLEGWFVLIKALKGNMR